MVIFRRVEKYLPSTTITSQSSTEKSSCRLSGNSPPGTDMQTVIPGSAGHKAIMRCNAAAVLRKGFKNSATVIAPPQAIHCGNSSREHRATPANRSRPGASPALYPVDLPEAERPVKVRSISRSSQPDGFASSQIQTIKDLLHQSPADPLAPVFRQDQKIADPGRFQIAYGGDETGRAVVFKADQTPFRICVKQKFDLLMIGYPAFRFCAAEKTIQM